LTFNTPSLDTLSWVWHSFYDLISQKEK
jgi:hypothetical protein